MPQFDPNETQGDDDSAASSIELHGYYTPLTSKESDEASSSSASVELNRAWTGSPETIRRTHRGSTPLSLDQESSTTVSRIPIIRENGPPSDVLFQCPEQKTLYYPTVWYRISAQADFLVCSRCYVSHIQGTSLAHPFTRFTPPSGAPSRCRFWVPRVVSVLWPQALRDQSVENIIDFAVQRNGIPDCPEVGCLENSRKQRWFAYIDEELGKLECCEACYEDRVSETAFAGRFNTAPEPPDGTDARKCILSIRDVQSSLEIFARCDDWVTFLAATRQRLRASDCRGRMVAPSSTDWFTPIGHDNKLWICEACFLDNVAMSAFHSHFTQARHLSPHATTTARFRCALSVGSVMVALKAAQMRNDYTIFINAANAIASSKFCSQSGIRGGPWYTLQGGCRGFQICQACYCGIIAPCEMGSFFDLADSQANLDSMVRLCDLNPAAPRFLSFVEKLAQVVDVGDFSVFDRYVRRIAMVPPCPRRSTRNNGLWCCVDGCIICPDCFETVASNTVFAHRFVLQRVSQPPPILCSLSSSQMRLKWAEACRDGSIEDFLSIARFRQEVYKQATSAIQHIKQVHGVRFGQALADVLLKSCMAAENGHILSTGGEDDSEKTDSRPVSRFEADTESTTLENLVKETLADTSRKDEQWLIQEIENVWKTID